MKRLETGKRQWLNTTVLFIACAVFFFGLMLCAPLSSDDLEHARKTFGGAGEMFGFALSYGNGRLLGNLSMVILSRHPVLAAAAKALLISGLVFMLPALLGMKSKQYFLASFLLFVSIRPSMFGQVYTWSSGFGNYIPPVWMSLAVLMLAKRYEALSSAKSRVFLCLLVLLLGFAGQLYVEHASIVNVLMAGGLLLYYRKNKKARTAYVCWLLAALIGLALMLLIPRLFALPGNRAEGYRGVINGGVMVWIEGMIRGFASAVSAFPPVGSVLIAAFTLVTLRLTRAKRSDKAAKLIFGLSALCLSYILFNELLPHNAWTGRMIVLKNFVTAVFAILPFALWAWALIPFEDKQLRNRIYALLALSLISVAPFFFVYPAPERVAFLSYVFAVAAILLFSKHLVEKASPEARKSCVWGVSCAAVAAVLVLGLTFVNILWLSHIREMHIAKEMDKGAAEISIFQIPHGYVFWDGTFLFERNYYYEQWHDITFRETTFDDWYVNHWMK